MKYLVPAMAIASAGVLAACAEGPTGVQPGKPDCSIGSANANAAVSSIEGSRVERSVVFVPVNPVAVSDDGTVVGNDASGPASWRNGELQRLSGFDHAVDGASGYVVGSAAKNSILRYPDGQTVTLGGLPGAQGSTIAFGMNANALIVGASGGRAFLWTACDGMTALATPEGASSAGTDINLAGDIAGFVETASAAGPVSRAVIWRASNGERVDIGSANPSHRSVAANAINDAGAVVGFTGYRARNANERDWGRAFVWTPSGGMRELETLGGTYSEAFDVNNRGEVVGVATNPSGTPQAFIWSEAEGFRPLDALGETHSRAVAISDAGDIIGFIGDKPVAWVAAGNESRWPSLRDDATPPSVWGVDAVPDTAFVTDYEADVAVNIGTWEGNGSGVASIAADFRLGNVTLPCQGSTLINGSAQQGVWRCTVTVPKQSPPGFYQIVNLRVTDKRGNVQTQAQGGDTGFTVR